MVSRRMVHKTEDIQVAVSHFNNRLFSQLQFQLVQNWVLGVKVAIQGEQIKKIVAVLDLAKCSNSKTSPHQDSVSSKKEVAMEEDTFQ